jgi:methyl-accepting chemotaxis protein
MKNLNVSTKLIILIMTMGVMGTFVGIFGISKIKQTNNKLEQTYKNALIPFQYLKNISDDYAIKVPKTVDKIYAGEYSWLSGKERIESALDNANLQWAEFKKLPKDERENMMVSELELQFISAQANLENLRQVLLSRDTNALKSYNTSSLNLVITPISKKITELSEYQIQKAGNIFENSLQNYKNSVFTFIIILFMGVVISMLMAIFILRGINNNLSLANKTIDKLAKGDLTQEIEKQEEFDFGHLINNLRNLSVKLKDVLITAQTASSNIAITSNEMSSNSQQVSQGATEQAASVEEMAASMEEISSNIQQNTDNAQKTKKISSQAAKEIEEGRQNINITVESMQTIAEKISIIGEIAFQTNILALNAAVEAARAGEHGKGFGVVAAEVGKLAERSKVAAAEIDELSKSGVEIALKSKEMLHKFVPSIEETSKLVEEISNASVEQNAGVEQINDSIQMLNQVTQQNAASSEEMATVSEELAAQADQLKKTINFFRLGQEIDSAYENYKSENKATRYIENPKPETSSRNYNKNEGFSFDLSRDDKLDDDYETF